MTLGGGAVHLNVTVNVTEEDVVAAVAREYLKRIRNKTEVLESVDASLEAFTKKLKWIADAKREGLLSDEEEAAQRGEVLGAFNALEP